MFIKVEIKMQLPPKVTNRAFERLAEIIPASSDKGLRIAVEGGGCSGFQYGFEFDSAIEEDDTVVENGDVKLLVDPLSIQYLAGGTVDYKEDLQGSRFVIDNPNASSTCGCGASFAI